jgi:hypothetical protein
VATELECGDTYKTYRCTLQSNHPDKNHYNYEADVDWPVTKTQTQTQNTEQFKEKYINPTPEDIKTEVTALVEEGKKMTGLFGNLDMDEVSDDPFGVAPSTYRAVVVDAKVVEKDGQYTLNWRWKIDEPGNEYHNMPVNERFGLWPEKEWADYTPDEKRTTKFLKLRLRTAFDLTKEEIDKLSPDQLIGKVAYITTKINPSTKEGDDRKFTNVQNAVSERLFHEQGGTPSDNGAAAAESSLGI